MSGCEALFLIPPSELFIALVLTRSMVQVTPAGCGATRVLLCVQVEKKAQTTVLTAALLLSGIPAEVINRSMDTYRRMGDVFADLCVYFFTFIISHEILQLFGSETP